MWNSIFGNWLSWNNTPSSSSSSAQAASSAPIVADPTPAASTSNEAVPSSITAGTPASTETKMASSAPLQEKSNKNKTRKRKRALMAGATYTPLPQTSDVIAFREAIKRELLHERTPNRPITRLQQKRHLETPQPRMQPRGRSDSFGNAHKSTRKPM
jgi:hypothetical protein